MKTMSSIPRLLARFGAIWIVMVAIHSFASSVVYMEGLSPTGYFIVLGGMIIVPLLIAFILWQAPAAFLGNDLDATLPDVSKAGLYGVAKIAVSLLALWVLVFGLIDLFYYEAEMWIVRKELGFGSEATAEQLAGRFTNILQILIGIGLWTQRVVVARLISSPPDAA